MVKPPLFFSTPLYSVRVLSGVVICRRGAINAAMPRADMLRPPVNSVLDQTKNHQNPASSDHQGAQDSLGAKYLLQKDARNDCCEYDACLAQCRNRSCRKHAQDEQNSGVGEEGGQASAQSQHAFVLDQAPNAATTDDVCNRQ